LTEFYCFNLFQQLVKKKELTQIEVPEFFRLSVKLIKENIFGQSGSVHQIFIKS